MSGIIFEHRPLTELPDDLDVVFRYWQELSADGRMPAWGDFDMMRIPASALPFTIVKDIEWPGPKFRYRYYGSGVARMSGSDQTGLTTEDILNADLSNAVAKSLAEYLPLASPICYRVISKSGQNSGGPVQYQLRLPLAVDGENMDCIVSILKDLILVKPYEQVLPSPRRKY